MIENGVNPEALAVSFSYLKKFFLFILQRSFSISSAGVGGMNYWMSEDKNKFL